MKLGRQRRVPAVPEVPAQGRSRVAKTAGPACLLTVVAVTFAPGVLNFIGRAPQFDYFNVWFITAVTAALLDTILILMLTRDVISRRSGLIPAAVENMIVLIALTAWSLAALPLLAFGLVAFGSG